jgi:hypothetical protein
MRGDQRLIDELEQEWIKIRGSSSDLTLAQAKARFEELSTESAVKKRLRAEQPFASTSMKVQDELTVARVADLGSSERFALFESDARVQLVPAAALALGDRIRRRRPGAGEGDDGGVARAAALQALLASASVDPSGWVRAAAALADALRTPAGAAVAAASDAIADELARMDTVAAKIAARSRDAVATSARELGAAAPHACQPLEAAIVGAVRPLPSSGDAPPQKRRR